MILAGIIESLGACPLIRGLKSPLFHKAMLAGLIGTLLPATPLPETAQKIIWFFTAPFLEELTWRTLLQNELEQTFSSGAMLTPGNIIASTAFALAHFAVSPGILAALTFFPSLVFGLLWTRFHSTWLCGILHLWYNLAMRIF